MHFTSADHEHMARALRLAQRGLYSTMPNPRVGCVIAGKNRIVGEGWHEKAGEPHAEIHALRAAGESARGATAYVSLEPCAHHGLTPPCVDALIAAGVARVIAAMQDPNPSVAGEGMSRLTAAGIETAVGLLEDEARELNIGFHSRMLRGRPWVRVKAAASLDGRTALSNGASQWITGEAARQDGHRLRARACAVLSGIGSVLADDPQMTVRGVEVDRQPLRVIVDSRLRTPPRARILQGGALVVGALPESDRKTALEVAGAEVLLLPGPDGHVDLQFLLRELGRRGMNELHVEAGRTLNGALLAQGLVDELVLYLAPIFLGNAARGLFDLPELSSLDEARTWRQHDLRQIGSDLRLILRPEGGP
jgi:diaminohydroxyphosphoribosylaminopyrimidine deaminase / 5-amino-6-(5-phosphoribosylamino)uracil reductase